MDRIRIAGTAAALILTTASERAADEQPDSDPAVRMPIFVPRDVGAPQARVRGASRGSDFAKIPSIDALVPEQMGYTLDPQPTLYWFLSDSTDRRVEFTLDAQGSESPDPQFETTLSPPHDAGINRIDLASHGIELKPGVTYMWYVTLLPDPESRSDARVSGGAIQLMTAPPELREALDASDAEEHPLILAAAGIWYDALSVLSEGVRSQSVGAQRGAQRAALLEQVGLGSVVVP
jgi:hypothetical protein